MKCRSDSPIVDAGLGSDMGSNRDGPVVRADAAEALEAVCAIRISDLLLTVPARRNWFLERLLKLGSIDVKKEYTCVNPLQP